MRAAVTRGAVAVLVAAGLAACGSGDSSPTSAGTTTTSAEARIVRADCDNYASEFLLDCLSYYDDCEAFQDCGSTAYADSRDYESALGEQRYELEEQAGEDAAEAEEDAQDAAEEACRGADEPWRCEAAVLAGEEFFVGSDCPVGYLVKGNQSYSGDWIYHLPGWEFYENTAPEECFDSAASAEDAGYRPSEAQ